MSGPEAEAENGAEWARKSDERERDLKNGRVGAERERSGSKAVSGLNRPLTIRSNLTIFVSKRIIRILQSVSKFRIRIREKINSLLY